MKILLMILVVILVILQYRLWFASDGLMHVFHLQNEIKQQQAKNDDLVKGNEFLLDEINSLKQGGVEIESRARNDLGMVKKGEVFYQIVK